ncbi:GNAT family N-acetyltransferase (plasmid) [Streptomyces sp. NBC_01591]|uniref:GNAT family N-acetyltransferase n=1 Tax=Streptomyces sp. NBC_01591 TaxID=2975888 RepID=UPI002DDA0B5F|nr:GNAT family N-acetyltransferase [Streptomyces sp. NBC_01591]WSD74007.1 GNAT family N-acetyltransferase [Streptomyces sp. NBC_01591]
MTMVTVEPFLPRHAAAVDLAAWCAVFSDGYRDSSGSTVPQSALAERLLAEEPPAMRWAARAGSGDAVSGVAQLRSQPHQPGTGFLRLFVAPSTRRNGIGSALLFEAMRTADEAGMDRLQSTVLAGATGESFARTVPGLRVVLRLELQEQRLDQEWVLARCRELVARRPSAYRLVHWIGPAPEQLAASFGRVMGHVLDAPGAALQMSSRTWDTAAVRAWEATMITGGEQLLVSAAVHSASGEVVAATVATVPASGGPVADQHDTAVLPEHRRQGLARWIKAEQAIRFHEHFPGVRAVVSTVNQENLPMTAVNRLLGYRPLSGRLLVEAPVVAGHAGP